MIGRKHQPNPYPEQAAVDFGFLEYGQKFRHMGLIYCKKDDRTAILIRSASGDEPERETVHTFYPENKIEPVSDDDF